MKPKILDTTRTIHNPEPGTECVHLEQTHEIVKFFRDILDVDAPRVALITETNVPHDENITYFGNGHDEAQMVYNLEFILAAGIGKAEHYAGALVLLMCSYFVYPSSASANTQKKERYQS